MNGLQLRTVVLISPSNSQAAIWAFFLICGYSNSMKPFKELHDDLKILAPSHNNLSTRGGRGTLLFISGQAAAQRCGGVH
jgi:hypothetical protein